MRVTVSTEAAEAVGEILRDLRGGGLVEERPAPGRVRFRSYLPPSRLLRPALRAVRVRIRGLRGYGLEPGRVSIGHRRVRARRWATAWRVHAKAVRVGRLLIRPSWVRAAPRPRDRVVAIDPGMAFGTGMHASTRLALRGLGRALARRRGAAVFDVGTGSGILAIAAAALGAAAVWAVDSDPVATAAARANARLNGCARRVRVADGSGMGAAPGRADVIVANIVADTIVELLPDARARLAPGGLFIGSGIVAGRVRSVLRAARAAGFQASAVLREGDWRAVLLSARPRSGSPASAVRRTRSARPR
ncbi:MAG TPA: 50S ribosomal protein L11 methyltransferase [bacterium]|nr:50S ribosomal protein L11 methyltransferase [bacterium]